MPIAFHAPAHAPHGASPVHSRRDVEDDGAAADAFTMLLLAATAVDEPTAAEDAAAMTGDGASGAAPGATFTPDGSAPGAAVASVVDPAIEAARAAAVAVGLPPVQPHAVATNVVTIVASERVARGGGVAVRGEIAGAAPLAAPLGATGADAVAFAQAHANDAAAAATAARGADVLATAQNDARGEMPRAPASGMGAAATAASEFALHLPSLEAPVEAKRAAPGRAASIEGTSGVAPVDGAYLRPTMNAPAVLHETIATPAFTAGWQDEAVGRMAHVVLTRNERAELTLHPAELGPVSIRVDLQADQASLTIVAASAETRSALEQSLPQLRDLLAEQGITLGQASVHDGSERRDDAERAAAAGTKALREAAVAAPVVATTWTVRPASGRVDLFA